jgi:HK97 family phage major capsid protein/HK97 family phage prohead protease
MLKRAYSVLEIRAVDEETRELTGIATTPTTDRYGDIVEPKGAEFTLPLPFLWQHDASQPIGHVTRAKATKDGIEVVIRLVKTDEPGSLKNRLDEAWQAIKLKLVRGLSIGFTSIEHAFIEGTYGIHFTKWAWLELSAVTIPANTEASITSIKSIDTHLRAASGREQNRVVRLSKKAGVSAHKSTAAEEANSMNIQEQIAAFEAKRAASAARMQAIMAGASEKGTTLDTEESEEYDTLEGELGTIDAHLKRLKSLEAVAVAKATRIVTPEEPSKAADLRGTPRVIQVEKKLDKGIAFARFVGCMAAGKGSMSDSLHFAKGHFRDDVLLHKTLELVSRINGDRLIKTAVDVGTSVDSDYAAPLVNYTNMAADFIDFLRPQTIIGRIPNLRRVPFNIRVPRQTGGGTAQWVGEGKPKPLTRQTFDFVSLTYMKLAVISVITEELARFSQPNAETLIRDDLAKAVIAQMDADFIDTDNGGVANVKPASITNGVTPIASAGNTENAVREDVRTMFASWIAGNLNPAGGVWVMPTSTAMALSLMVNALGQPSFPGITMNGGTFFGLPVVTSESQGLTDNSAQGHIVALVNAPEILLADDGQVTIDVSREASVQMDDAPTDPPVAATVFQSFWQQNLIGIKAERFITWVKGRSTAVVVLASVNWGEDLS